MARRDGPSPGACHNGVRAANSRCAGLDTTYLSDTVIRDQTVFVLGAGASVGYGLPLGGELVSVVTDALSPRGFLRQPMLGLYSESDVDEFIARLKGVRLDSIDAFLEGNTDRFQEIGKAAIAASILHQESLSAGRLAAGREKGSIEDDWLTYVWKHMKAACPTADSFSSNNVTFVTFNYDRLVEYFFTEVLRNAYDLSLNDARALRAIAAPVLHLHGSIEDKRFGAPPQSFDKDTLQTLGKGIRIVHDAPSEQVFQRAYKKLQVADRVCLLGFGYHETNITNLNFPLWSNRLELVGSVFGLRRAEIALARERIGTHFEPGDPEHRCEEFLGSSFALR